MAEPRHNLRLALFLLVPSLLTYAAHYAIFRNAHDIVYYLLMDVAFLFVQGLLVTLVIEQLLTARERQARRMKQNMVIGVFYSEVGTRLLGQLCRFDPRAAELTSRLRLDVPDAAVDFVRLQAAVAKQSRALDARLGDLAALRGELLARRDLLLRLLENPNLIEHDRFTELLWAVFHLAEELGLRDDLGALAESDRQHLEGDLQRVFDLLLREWLAYLQHLQAEYPYLFSLAVRTNPFDPAARVEVGALAHA
jgi:hypothetical protein